MPSSAFGNYWKVLMEIWKLPQLNRAIWIVTVCCTCLNYILYYVNGIDEVFLLVYDS